MLFLKRTISVQCLEIIHGNTIDSFVMISLHFQKEAEEERKVLTKLENDHTAEQKLAELKVLYSQLTIDIEAHRASHRNTFFAENIEVEAEEPTSSTPLISAGNAVNYGSSGDGQTVPLAQPEAAPKKTLLQKLCCCCGGN